MYKFLHLIILGILIVFGSFSAIAQQYTGCLLPAGTLHYQQNGTSGGKTNYNTTPNVSSGSVYCIATVTTSPNCRVNKSSATANQGTKRTFYLVQCPIDDYVPLFIIMIGGLGYFAIRNRITSLC